MRKTRLRGETGKLAIVAACAITLAGCATSWHSLSRSALISFERHGEPDLQDVRLLVNENGTFVFEADGPDGRRIMRKKGTLAEERVARLVRAFNSSGFVGAKGAYSCGGGHDESGGCGHGHAGPGGCKEGEKDPNWFRISYKGKSVKVFGCSPMLLIPLHQNLAGIAGDIEASR